MMMAIVVVMMVMMTGKQNKKERKRRGVKTVGQVMRLVENEVRKRERERGSQKQ